MSTLRAVTVETTPPYAVQIGAGALSLSTPSFAEAHALIADEHVFKLYGDAPASTNSHATSSRRERRRRLSMSSSAP